MNVEWAFLTKLRDMGRDTATRWLDENFAGIGERSTVDLHEMFQGIGAEHQGGLAHGQHQPVRRPGGGPPPTIPSKTNTPITNTTTPITTRNGLRALPARAR